MSEWIAHSKELFMQSLAEVGQNHQHALDLQTQHQHFTANCMVWSCFCVCLFFNFWSTRTNPSVCVCVGPERQCECGQCRYRGSKARGGRPLRSRADCFGVVKVTGQLEVNDKCSGRAEQHACHGNRFPSRGRAGDFFFFFRRKQTFRAVHPIYRHIMPRPPVCVCLVSSPSGGMG